MKTNYLLLAFVAAAAFVAAGCSKQESGAPAANQGSAAAASVDTSKLQAAFQSAAPAAKSAADTALSSIKKADYSDALTQLKGLGEKFKLTPEQQKAVNDVIAQVQKMVSSTAAKAASEASKAAGEAGKTLSK